MPLSGKLHLRIEHDAEGVRGVEIRSTRPRAYRVLAGRMPEVAVQLAPLLFSVCGRAQRAAAVSAIYAARGGAAPNAAELERAVACEAIQEHLWRLLLDWPVLLGQPQQVEAFSRWHAALGDIAAGRGRAENLSQELHVALTGMNVETWRRVDSSAALEAWWQQGEGFMAPLFATLAAQAGDGAQPVSCGLLPAWDALETVRERLEGLDDEFAALPHIEGQAFETGALAYWQHAPLMQQACARWPSRILPRTVARLVDLLDSAETLARGASGGRVRVAAEGYTGLSLVRTARGMLLHVAQLAPERIEDYLIVAPTEWNFHPRGALAQGLAGLRENDAQKMQARIRQQVLSLDPCVEYEVELNYA